MRFGLRSGDEIGLRPPRELGTYVKGGAGMMLYVQDCSGTRFLPEGEPVAPGGRLLLELAPAGHRFAAAALIDADGAALLYDGPARPGPLPDAFEWTGSGRARLVLEYADLPIDEKDFVGRLDRPPGPGVERVTLELKR